MFKNINESKQRLNRTDLQIDSILSLHILEPYFMSDSNL